MNNQLSPTEKATLEKNFLEQNFKFVEKKIKGLLANGYNEDLQELWLLRPTIRQIMNKSFDHKTIILNIFK